MSLVEKRLDRSDELRARIDALFPETGGWDHHLRRCLRLADHHATGLTCPYGDSLLVVIDELLTRMEQVEKDRQAEDEYWNARYPEEARA